LEIIFDPIFNIYHSTPILCCTTGVGSGDVSASPSFDLVKSGKNPLKYEQKWSPK